MPTPISPESWRSSWSTGYDGRMSDTPRIDHDIRTLDGETFSLGVYRGLGIVIVNLGSKGGAADQIPELEKLYRDYGQFGLMVVGVPSDDFNGEPGDDQRVRARYELDMRVSFAVTQRMRVGGDRPAPLYRALTAFDKRPVIQDGEKFIIDGDGYVSERFPAAVRPLDERVLLAVKFVLPTMGY